MTDEAPTGAGTPKPEGAAVDGAPNQPNGQNQAPDPTKATPQPKVVPDKYDLKLPKDSLLEAAHIEKTMAYAKEKGLSQDEAQSLLEREHAVVAAYVDAERSKLEIQKDEWVKLSNADKEFGGEKFKQSVELAHRVLAKHGSQALKGALNETGLGNHPELIRLLVRIGKGMADDSAVFVGREPAPEKSAAEILYGANK